MGLVEALLALALLVIVPLGLRLHPASDDWWPRAAVACAVPAAVALTLQQSLLAGLLAAPWLVLVGWFAALVAWRWLRDRSLAGVVDVAALAYLTVGAGWLVLDRVGVEPVGVRPPFVVLTAVHFHYAGFVATLLAALVLRRTLRVAPRAAVFMAAAIVVSPPIVAAGFTFAGPLQIVGATILTAGLWTMSWLTLRHVAPGAEQPARTLLTISAVAVLVPMLLAVQWAMGWNYGTPALSIPVMARTHGVVNALGFALCGVIGWQRLPRHQARRAP